MNNDLYVSVTNCSGIFNVNVVSSHNSPISMATIECKSTSLEIGDSITIDMGYTDSHGTIFTGYVKQIVRQVQSDTYGISAYDVMVRSQDFFIASSTPDSALKYRNITAEALVGNLLSLAGISSYTYDDTSFTFGVQNEFEVNLTAVADYCRMVSDLLTWHLWGDRNGTAHFENRKPYYVSQTMVDEYQQYNLSADTSTGFEINSRNTMSATYSLDDKNLRNRVVVYGTGEAHGEATIASPYLPDGFYKTALLAAAGLLDDNAICQKTAEYNLNLLHKLTKKIQATVIGNYTVEARSVIEVDLPEIDQPKPTLPDKNLWYVFTVEHSISSAGYVINLELTK